MSLRPSLPWLLLALFAVAAVAPPDGFGLCLGDDGHVEVAAASDGCPCEEPPAPDRQPGDQEHGGCRDLFLDGVVLGLAPGDLDAVWDGAPAALPAVDVDPDAAASTPVTATGRVGPAPWVPPDRSLRALRSVVLRL